MLPKLLLVVVTISSSFAERSHKVHNIILYPEKYSWCQTTPIRQVVASPGYEPVTIDNNICVGACYSYSIPSTQPAEPGELLGPYCDSCQPLQSKCYHVTLHADSKNTEGPRTFQKRVQIILNCSCMSCEKIHREECEITDQNTLELPQDLFSNRSQEAKTEEVPELLHFARNKKRPSSFNVDVVKNTTEQRFELNSKLIDLLKSIQDEDSSGYNKEQLKELLKIIEGSENELSERNLMEFVNFVNTHNSEDLEVDLGRLKDVLGGLRHDHRLGDEMHIGVDVGHLVKGPHGSMVMAPDLKVEEKLNIDSDVLKPNHDGVVIAYENHRTRKTNDILTN